MRIKEVQPGRHLLLLYTVFLILMSIVSMVSNSFRAMQDAFNTMFQIIPVKPTVQNYIYVFSKLPLLKITMNIFSIVTTITVFKIVTGLLAACSLVYFDFKGKRILYFIMLTTMFTPSTVAMTPNYLMISEIDLSGEVWGVALSQLADVLGVSLLCQSMQGVPRTLTGAARIRNMKSLKIMRDIITPLTRPSIISTGIIFSTSSWNEHVWPALVLKNRENCTLPLALQMYISAKGGTESTIIMAVPAMAMVIPLASCVPFQRYIIDAFIMSRIKGQGVGGQGNQIRRG